VFVTKIPKDEEHNAKWLEDNFSKYGDIKSLKISLNPDHSSRGYGFVCFQEPHSATDCLTDTAGNDTTLAVKYQPRDRREFRRVFNNIYVKNLPDSYDEEKTRELFAAHGNIGLFKYERNDKGAYALIAYMPTDANDRESGPAAAALAVEKLNGLEIEGKKLYVKEFLKKSDRSLERKRETMKYKNSKKRCNLYVKNIPEDSTEETLRQIFEPYGDIESIKLFPKDGIKEGEEDKGEDGKKAGQPKNLFCFVCYKKPDAASTAKEKLSGLEIQGRPLYINHYEIKEIREIQNEETQDKIGFRQFRMQYAENKWSETVNQDELLLCLSRILKQIPRNLWQSRGGGQYPQMGGAPQGQQQRGGFQGGNKGYGGQRDNRMQGQRQQHMGGMQGQNRQGSMPQGMMQGPMGQQMNMPMPNQQPMGGQQQIMGGQPMAGQQFGGQQREQSVQDKYLAATLPILPGITNENPYYRNQVGTVIYEFVVALKGDKAPKITGMLIDL